MSAPQDLDGVRGELMRAVVALVSTGGVRAVTEQAIESLSGHSADAVTEHFGNLRALVLATAAELAGGVILSPPDPSSEPESIDEVLTTLVDGYRAYVSAAPTKFAALLHLSSAGIFGDPALLAPLTAQHHAHRAAARAHLAQLRRTGLTGIATADIAPIAANFADSSHGIEMCHLLEDGEDRRAEAYVHLTAALHRRIVNQATPGHASTTDDGPPAPSSDALSLDPDYRLSLLLEPSGIVRDLLAIEGIRGWNSRTYLGRPVGEAAARGPRGQGRAEQWATRLEIAHSQPGPAHYEDPLPGHDASGPARIFSTVTPIHDAAGILQSILVDVENRSGRIAAQADADLQQQQLRIAVELTTVGTYVLYLREPRIIANARFAEIYGRDPQVLMDTGGVEAFYRFIHAEDRDAVREALEAAMTGDVDYVANFRFWLETSDGPELRWVSGLGRVEMDDEGPLRVFGVIEDVTDRYRREQAFLVSQKREAIGTLAAGIAHDFNNVLSVILGNASAADRQVAIGESAAESVQEITQAARRAGELVERLLSFTRDDQAPRKQYSVRKVVHEACALVRPTLGTGIELHEALGSSLPSALGDPTGLQQVILNLVVNADYAIGDQAGRIDVTVETTQIDADRALVDPLLDAGEYIRIRVRDNGPGIPKEAAARAFDPFFTTNRGGDRAGLGLAGAQAVIRNHGGSITFDTDPELGTLFTILLPVAERQTSPQSGGTRKRVPGVYRPRVLFLDDEHSLTDLAARVMTSNGCVAIAVNDAATALERLRSDPIGFDAIITDLAMPDMNGLQFVRRVRVAWPSIPIVLTSGFISAGARAEAERLGVGRVVPKPCSIGDLAAAVLDLIDGLPPERSAA